MAMSCPVVDNELRELSNLISERMGIDFADRKLVELRRGIERAAIAFGHHDANACLRWLLTTPLTQEMIETLASYLTIGETYFFRDEKTLKVIEERVLPETIRGASGTNKILRIWSAGCSTGEEPYSIAIMLHRNIPDLSQWKVTILATDINPVSLRKAEEGIYTEWSFRGMPPVWKKQYFEKEAKGRYRLSPEIKRLVTFSYHNLAQDPFPSLLNNTNAMNVILCRNVLMYFSAKVRRRVVQNLSSTLVEGGWLLSSPAETGLLDHSSLKKVTLFGALVHRKMTERRTDKKPEPVALINPLNTPGSKNDHLGTILEDKPGAVGPVDIATRVPDLSETYAVHNIRNANNTGELRFEDAQRLYEQGRYEEITTLISSLPQGRHPAETESGRFAALAARCFANVGKLEEAEKWCRDAIQVDKMNPSYHYLCATIQQELGQTEDAMRSFQKALYLDQSFVPAHFALANLTRSLESSETSRRHFRNVLQLLEKYKDEDPIPETEGLTAARLRAIVLALSGGV
jgi:chemotaxis protein methyltransferase CheR